MSSIDENEVNKFKELVKEWLSFDDDIRQLDNAKKELTKRKKELTEPILDFMAKNIVDFKKNH